MKRRARRPFRPDTIVSGGQTGVDRAALDAAIALGIALGGWCPRGRLAEDGTIPARYALRETGSPHYAVRTERNVAESDATLILHQGTLRGGTALTRRLAEQHAKPCLVVDLTREDGVTIARAWLEETRPSALNVAGPRESQRPGIAALARAFLVALFSG